MANLVLPASPNWYLSQISDSNRDGVYVFGARHDVAIFDISSVPNISPRFINSFYGHKDRVSCVKLGQSEGQLNICCSSADDLQVKLWDVHTHVEIHRHSEHQEKITAMAWSNCKPDLIVTGDEKGTIITWIYRTDETHAFRPEKDFIFTMACCPHDSSLLAAGYKSGNIFLLNISSRGQVVHKLRGHNEEVHSVVWCPVPGEDVLDEQPCTESGNPQNGFLLVSGSRDRTIRVWNSSQGKQLQLKKLPVNTGYRREQSDSQGRGKVWTALFWPQDNPTRLVSSSFGGELLMWDLSSAGHSREVFHTGKSRIHSRIVFNICAGGKDMKSLFTVSMDRTIVVWDLEKLSSVMCVPSLGGHVYSVTASPVDPGRIAVGVGDSTILVWNISNKSDPFDVNILWQGIKSKVTALCWHPTKEGHLAYGTEDGRVGIYDVMSSRPPHLSSTFHRRTVYEVAFGPPSEDESGKGVSLYSVGDCTVLEHRPHCLDKEAKNINTLIDSVNGKRSHSFSRTAIAWKPDNTAVAIASDDGSIEVLEAGTFRLLGVVKVHRKLINCMKWHPQFTADKPLGSESKYWLASGANDAIVNVYDLSSVLDPSCDQVGTISDSMRKLEGHSIRITGISWNPHVEGQLVSVGYDNKAYIWNVKTGEAMCQYDGHIQRILCVAWSGVDPDEVMSGGFDSMLHRWRVSSASKAVIELGKKKKKKKKHDVHASDKTESQTLSSTGAAVQTDDLAKGDHSQAKSIPQYTPAGSIPDEELPVTKASEKGKRTRVKKDFQEELDELREMLDMRKKQILKQNEKRQEGQQSRKMVPPTGGESSHHDYDDDLFAVEKAEESIEEQSVDKDGQQHLVGEDIPDDQPHWEGLRDEAMYERSEETLSVSEAILGPRYSMPEKKEEGHLSDRDRSLKKETSVPDSATRKRKTRPKSVFPLSAKEENRGRAANLEDLLLLARLKISDPETQLPDDSFHLGLFTDRRGTYNCLKKEGAHHVNNDNMEYAIQLEIWKGNIGGALQIARDREELSDWLVSLAPLASYNTWLNVCEEYARQLESDGQYHKATSYLLACHKVYEAIELFKRHRLFKEAVGLARVRLSPLDPVLEDLYMEWAQTLMKDGNYEQGAKCYLAMKQIQDAANLLTKRTDQSSLKTATHMTLLANEKPQGLLYAHRLVHQFIAKDDWKQGYTFLKEHETLKMLIPFVSMHELLWREVQTLIPGTLREVDPSCFSKWEVRTSYKGVIPDFILDVSECDPVLPWKPYMIGEHSFLHHVLKVWCCNLDLPMDSESLTLTYRTLQQLQSWRQSHIDPQQLMFQVCMDLTLCLLAILIGETSNAINHVLHPLCTLHTVGQFELMEAVCQLMLPLGPKYLLKLQQEATALRVLISMEAHLEVEGSGKVPSLKRYLTEIKDDDTISTSSLRCRELDCLRAFYYLAVLHCLKQSIREENLAQDERAEASVDDDAKIDLEANPSPQTNASGQEGSEHPSSISSTLSQVCDSQNTSKPSAVCASDGQEVSSGSSELVESSAGKSELTKVNDPGQTSALDKDDRPSAEGHDQRNESSQCQTSESAHILSINKLKQISRGLLWDVQAKKHSLTETLGYIHKAISKHLLSDKSKDHQPVVFNHVPPRGHESGAPPAHGVNGVGADPSNQNDSSAEGSAQSEAVDHSNGQEENQVDVNTLPDDCDLPEHCDADMMSFSGAEVFSKSRKVLWEDDPQGCENLEPRPRKASCVLNPAKYINVPDEWYGMPVDEKYFRPYVTMAILKEEQDYVMHELKRIPESSVVSFPNPFDSVSLLLELCRLSHVLNKETKTVFSNQLVLWALHFAVTSGQRSELSKLIQLSPEKESEV